VSSHDVAARREPSALSALTSAAYANGGKDSIDHSPGAHDDIANSVAGLAAMLTAKPSYNLNALADVDEDDDDPDGAKAFRMQRFMDHIRRCG
jgi:hypothetical protein